MSTCICLTAPTACGKTDLALELAAEFPLEIISMDSALVYRGMDIGTAKPSADIRAAVPHHLIDILEPSESYSAGRFARDAGRLIDDIQARGKLPLIVGGTMLYLRALREGLTPLPRGDATLRAELDAQAAELGWPGMHERLARVDPESAARIAPRDRQRIQRALEVHALTGQPLSALHTQTREPRHELVILVLVPEDRAALAARIERRFDAMLAAGLVEELRALRARGDLHADMPSMRSVSYRQIWAHLEGAYELGEARRRAVVATRRLAKRQLTWLRAERDMTSAPALSLGLAQRLGARIREALTEHV